jgi:hypothetical protein
MVSVSLDSSSCEVTLFDPVSVVYRDATQQAKGLHRLKYVGALEKGLVYLSQCNSGWFCHMMVQMMEVRSVSRKPLFSGQLTLKKMINRILYLNNPPNDPSSFEYSLKRLFNFEIVKLYPVAGYLTSR